MFAEPLFNWLFLYDFVYFVLTVKTTLGNKEIQSPIWPEKLGENTYILNNTLFKATFLVKLIYWKYMVIFKSRSFHLNNVDEILE